MNEQIRKLLVECYNPYGEFHYEKFAELIVRECMSNLYLNGYDDAMVQIQKHFGVKQ